MGKVDDYINSLDGQENLDVAEVASKLLELHNEEIGTATAKISTLSDALSAKDATIAEKVGELSVVKAQNWDLVNQLPVSNKANAAGENQGNEKPDPGTINFDDVLYADTNKE